MASGQEVFHVGEVVVTLYHNTGMKSSNGLASPIVAKPSDCEGLIAEMAECPFYIYAPQFRWSLTVGAKDRLARSAVEMIAHEQFRIGTQAEGCHRWHHRSVGS